MESVESMSSQPQVWRVSHKYGEYGEYGESVISMEAEFRCNLIAFDLCQQYIQVVKRIALECRISIFYFHSNQHERLIYKKKIMFVTKYRISGLSGDKIQDLRSF